MANIKYLYSPKVAIRLRSWTECLIELYCNEEEVKQLTRAKKCNLGSNAMKLTGKATEWRDDPNDELKKASAEPMAKSGN